MTRWSANPPCGRGGIAILFAAVAALLPGFAAVAPAQLPTDNWTGAVSANWVDPPNWSLGAPPTTGQAAYFNGPGNGNTAINLGGLTQSLGALQFDAGAASYVIGTAAGGTLSFAADNNGAGVGAISVTAGATVAQAVNANVAFTTTAPLITNASTTAGTSLTLGASPGSATLSVPDAGTLTITPTSPASIIVNDSITASASLTVTGNGTATFNGPLALTGGTITVTGTGTNSTAFNGVVSGSTAVLVNGLGTVSFTNQNTYSGTTTLQSTGQPVIRIGSSSQLSGTTLVSGPFGTGQIVFSSATPAVLTPVGGDQTVANPIKFTNGFFAGNAVGDPHNLFLTGPLTMDTAGRTSTVNMFPGFATFLGSSPNQATFTLLNLRMTFQTQPATSQNGGLTIINDTVTSTGTGGGLTVQNSAQLVLNGTNSYAGTTIATGTAAAGFGRVYINGTNSGTGAVNAQGVGTLGTGGTVGGVGSVAGPVNISTTTAGTQGGFLSPGAGINPVGNGIGTFSIGGALTLNPKATYNFDHQPDATQFPGGNAAPGTSNDTVNVTGALSLVNLAAGTAQAQFNLVPNFTTTNFTPGPTGVDYQAASFGSITLPTGFTGTAVTLSNGVSATDVTPLFTFTGAFDPATSPLVAYTGTGGSGVLVVQFVPVPEPAFVLAACGGLGAVLRLAGSRRRPGLFHRSPSVRR
jgi:fibronectin-binding autotransporter adhesin